MNKHFKEALEAGHVELAEGPNKKPLIVNGVDYYESSENGINMMMKRFHSFGDVLRKHDTLKISDDGLTTALSSQRDMLRKALANVVADSETSIDCIREALTLTERIQQRRAFGLDVSQVYDIVSLWYFTENEDPGEVDMVANRKKIADWTAAPNSAELYAFFLHQPLGKFVPLSSLLGTDTLTYTKAANQLELLDLTRILIASQTLGLTQDTIDTIELRRQTLYGYDGLIEQQLNPITTT